MQTNTCLNDVRKEYIPLMWDIGRRFLVWCRASSAKPLGHESNRYSTSYDGTIESAKRLGLVYVVYRIPVYTWNCCRVKSHIVTLCISLY